MRMITAVMSYAHAFLRNAKKTSCVAVLVGAMAAVASAVQTTSFSPIFVRNAAGALLPLTWTYTINHGEALTVEEDGMLVTCKYSDVKLSVNPTTKIREGSFGVSLSGRVQAEGSSYAVTGSATAKFTEALENLTNRVSVKSQKVNIGINLSVAGYGMSVLANMLTQFSPSAEWFLDRSDLDQLGVGYQWDGEVTGKTTGSVKVTLPGYPSETEPVDLNGTVPDAWAIVDILDSFEVGGKTYENVVVVERYTEVPTGDLSGSVTDATITYWVAKGVGMIKGVGQYQFMKKPLEIELKNATLLQAQTLTFPEILAKEIGESFDPGAKATSLLAVTYESSDESVALVNPEGLIETVAAGTTVITASQSGNNMFSAAKPLSKVLVVKSRVSAEIDPAACGAVTGTGLYTLGQKVTLTAKPAKNYMFLNWEDGYQAPVRTLYAGTQNQMVTASFGLIAAAGVPVVSNPGAQEAMVGVTYEFPLPITSECLPTVVMTGLPPGLKYDAGTVKIVGVPSKSGSYNVTFKASNVKGFAAVQAFTMTVDKLPIWAQGTFSGVTETEELGAGVASMSVSELGKMTGKLSMAGTNYSFSAGAFTRGDMEGVLVLACTATVGKVSIPLSLHTSLASFEGATEGVRPETLGVAMNMLADGVPAVSLYRNVWKDADMVAVATNYAGYYTTTLPGGGDCGSGYLAFTVDKLGNVKTAGKLADGTAVSLSGTLIVDLMSRVCAVLYTVPAAYKGGGFFGVVEFVNSGDGSIYVRLADSELAWTSFDPKATKEYGAGFQRALSISGGRYSSGIDLRVYYENGLAVGCDALPPLLAAVKYIDTTEGVTDAWTEDSEISAASGSPAGLLLGVMPVTGIGTGLVAPKVDTVIKGSEAGEYDYSTDSSCDDQVNTAGLTLGFTKATGLFKGSFTIYYDYVSQVRTTDSGETPTWSHTAKKATFEGLLTPVRESVGDGLEGRGFSLISERAVYDSGKVDAYDNPIWTSYNVNGSYEFQLLMP